ANWPRWVDPAAPEAKPYPGWPVTFDQTDNYGREAAGWLPELVVSGLEDPVVQVIEEAGGKVVYTLRIKGRRFTPKVFAPGSYTVRVGGQGDGDVKVFDGLKPQPAGKAGKLEVVF
ncbi:MAG TPA: twin-arginine translocation pathway signal protein, partial [Candidatus Glassbacteria bacterium]|nr:twin-arginine translocation pathway signal protein [Candidatus Glassbacteria bacterium]